MTRPPPDTTLSQEIAAISAVSSTDETAAGLPHSTQHDPADSPRFAPPTVEGDLGRLGKYRILKELGRGGMGAVYLAFDERLQRKVALKVMLPKATAKATAKDRFLREARAAACISSDYVVSIHEADEIDGTPYIALQYLQGYPLDEYLKKKGLPSLPQVVRIGQETALGLAAAHKLGLVHRDIKPGNIWLEAPNGRVKILDFGLAKPVEEADGKELTASGALVGTPAYMAPEQGLGLALDGRADLFSLGCLLYRLSTGRLPFDRPGLMATVMAVINEEPPPVRELNPQVPEALAELIQRLMAKNPAARPADAAAVADQLAAMSENFKQPPASGASAPVPQVVYVPIQITTYPSDNSASAFADLDEPDSMPAEVPLAEPTRTKPRGSFAWIAAGFAMVLALAIGGIVIIIKNKDGTETKIEVPEGAAVEVKKDGKSVAKVGPTTPIASPDRKAAEYVLSIGGTLLVNGENKWMKDVAELPKEPFRLTGFNLSGNDKVTDAGLGVFKDCKNLMFIAFLGNDRLTDAGLVHFKGCNNLLHLDITKCVQITDKGLANFKDCNKLTSLSISHLVRVTDAGLANFKDVETLRHLILSGCTQVGDAGLAYIKNHKDFQTLNLENTQVTDLGLAKFKDCNKLLHIVMDVTLALQRNRSFWYPSLPREGIQ